MNEGLFFIVGCCRSGTTLLKTILNAHPQIFVPAETFFFTGIADAFDDETRDFESMANRILDKWWIRDMDFDAKDLKEMMADQTPNWTNMFVATLAAISRKSDAIRFGEKTVGHVVWAERFLERYPNCHVIQMIRDPRAVFASIRNCNVRSNQVYGLTKEWARSIRIHKKLQGHERYHAVQFEDLILDTDKTLRGICDQLNLPFDQAMLNYHQRDEAGYSPEQVQHANTRKPIFASNIDRWKDQLTANHIGIIEFDLREEMNLMGYELTNTKVNFPKARLAWSSIAMLLSRVFIRKPQQMLKAFRAKKRQNQSNSQT